MYIPSLSDILPFSLPPSILSSTRFAVFPSLRLTLPPIPPHLFAHSIPLARHSPISSAPAILFFPFAPSSSSSSSSSTSLLAVSFFRSFAVECSTSGLLLGLFALGSLADARAENPRRPPPARGSFLLGCRKPDAFESTAAAISL